MISASVISKHIFPGHSNALGYGRLKGLLGVKCSEVSVQQIKNDILTNLVIFRSTLHFAYLFLIAQ